MTRGQGVESSIQPLLELNFCQDSMNGSTGLFVLKMKNYYLETSTLPADSYTPFYQQYWHC